MNELTRMQYLAAMSIESFVPRSILPAAKASVACVLPEVWLDDLQDDIVDVQPLVHPALRPSASQVSSPSPAHHAASQSLVKDILAPSQALAETPLARIDSDRTLQQLLIKSRHKPLSFSLSVWSLANGVVIIDSREPKAALPTSALLHNIVMAFARDGVIPKPDFINWPLLHSATANPNETQDAQEMTQAFLASRFEMAAPKVIVVMGEMAASIVLNKALLNQKELNQKELNQAAPDNYGTPITSAHLPCPAVCLPSLAQLLKEPLLKRFIWLALKPWF
ncbi:MAG: hypothetical protein U5M23_00920 [Marinagarivorans sp.]|nr:hypothetical protein [Marinagarivorans sp.]